MSISIRPEDIDTITDGGILDGQPVKILRTRGGYHMAVVNGKVVSGGSHPAIVKHAVSKMFPNFQPALCKSENSGMDAIIDQHSHFLSDSLRKSGYDIYSIQEGTNIEFQVTKHNIKVAGINGSMQDGSLALEEIDFPKEFKKSLAAATTEKAIAVKAKNIKIK